MNENKSQKTKLRVVSEQKDEKTAIRCQVHGEEILKSCGLDSCIFFTKYPNVQNCTLVYMAKQGVEALKPIDIGMLKGIPAKKVSRDLARATQLMRNDTLKVSRQVEVEPKFKTVTGLECCAHCEKPINYRNKRNALESKLPRSKELVYYCSQECQDTKPPQHIAAEAACQTDIKIIVTWAVKKYSTLGGLEQALGMNRALLGETLQGLLGINADELYSTTQRVKTRSRALVRRTGSRPEWLVNFQDVVQPLVDDMKDKYGKPSVDYSSLLERVKQAIETI